MAENNNYLNDSRRKNWFWDFNDIFNSSLSSNAILVRLYLARCADNTTRQAFPSLKNIAEHCKLSRATVKRAINELIEKGWLIKEVRKDEEGDYDSNLYTLCDPPVEPNKNISDKSTDEGGRVSVNLPCNEMTPTSSPLYKQNIGGWAHSEPTVGSQRTEGWAHSEPTVGSQRATNNTYINNTHINNTQQQQDPVVVVVENNGRKKFGFSAGPSPEEVEDLRSFAEEKGIVISERFAATYIAAAGSVEAAKELVGSCASYIAREKQNGHEIGSVAAILSNAVKNFLTGAAVNRNIVWGLSSKEDKYRDLYLNRLEE